MSNVKMNYDDTLSTLQNYQNLGVRLLGLDGFEVVNDGYIARLDLILDLTIPPFSQNDPYDVARSFITKAANDEILFEIWVDD